MSRIITALMVFLSVACFAQKSQLSIPPQNSVEIDFVNYKLYALQLKNKSKEPIEVSVINKSTKEQSRGFGLSKRGEEWVNVELNHYIKLTNNSGKWVVVTVVPTEKDPIKDAVEWSENVSFTLRNETLKSIPLIIPGVMNPNLSPKSNSAVTLNYGQKIFFKHKRKRYLLLTVDENVAHNEVIKVGDLILERKKALGLN